MLKISSIILLFSWLIGQTPLQQVLRLPELFGHFNDHNDEGVISLSEFMYNHYVDEPVHDGDDDEDEKLPFRSAEIVFNIASMNAVPLFPNGIRVVFHLLEAEWVHIDEKSSYGNFIGDIFHPPLW